MKRYIWAVAGLLLAGLACSGRQLPQGPPPEYERPQVMPWPPQIPPSEPGPVTPPSATPPLVDAGAPNSGSSIETVDPAHGTG